MSQKYTVYANGWASTVEEIEADSPEEAVEQHGGMGSLCHQCSNDVEMNGDVDHFVVFDANSKKVYDDDQDSADKWRWRTLIRVLEKARKDKRTMSLENAVKAVERKMKKDKQ